MAETRVLTGAEAELFKAVSDIIFSDSSDAVKANRLMQLIQSRDSEIERKARVTAFKHAAMTLINKMFDTDRSFAVEATKEIIVDLQMTPEISHPNPADKEKAV